MVLTMAAWVAGSGACGGSSGFDVTGDVSDGASEARSDAVAPPADAGPGDIVTDASVTDAASEARAVRCGTSSCQAPAQSCCVYDPPRYACVDGPSCPADDAGNAATALRCSATADCAPGTVCCLYETPSRDLASDCRPGCSAREAQLCDPAAATSGCAPDAGACSSANVSDWGLPPTYATCGGVGN